MSAESDRGSRGFDGGADPVVEGSVFNGLGEFYYTNGISENQEDFMEIVSAGQEISADALSDRRLEGCLVPVGGGKDSAVTLSLLKGEKETNCCYIINPRGATLKTVERAGYGEAQMCCVKRTLDKNMLELNKQGYLNGHTPFSAIVAFSATIAAYMEGKNILSFPMNPALMKARWREAR